MGVICCRDNSNFRNGLNTAVGYNIVPPLMGYWSPNLPYLNRLLRKNHKLSLIAVLPHGQLYLDLLLYLIRKASSGKLISK